MSDTEHTAGATPPSHRPAAPADSPQRRLRRRASFALLLLAALLVAWGPAEDCETDAERQDREYREMQSLARMAGAFTPPVVTRIESTLAFPVTTYSVSVKSPYPSGLSYEWSMTGEACGTPRVEWKQSGATVKWSHSDQRPDLCQHQGTNHAVVATVVVKNASGVGQRCSIEGSETKVVDSPKCEDIRPATP